jgi:hypothetical protein
MDQESHIEHNEDEVDDGAAEEHWMKATEDHMADEDDSKRRFPVDAQPLDPSRISRVTRL